MFPIHICPVLRVLSLRDPLGIIGAWLNLDGIGRFGARLWIGLNDVALADFWRFFHALAERGKEIDTHTPPLSPNTHTEEE